MTDIDVVSLVLQTPGALPPNVIGGVGIGKSARMRQLAAAMDWDIEVLSPGERGDGAFGVVPVPDMDGKVLRYPIPEWAERFMGGKPGIVFVDEINTCAPALMPALLGLLLDGRIGGHQLPPTVRRAAAMNPVDQAASGWDLPPALANRMVYLQWSAPSAEEWSYWLRGDAKSKPQFLKLDHAAWQHQWTMSKALGMAFLRRKPAHIAEDISKAAGRFPPAIATPRTWETTLRLLATCRAVDSMDVFPMLATGCLGQGIAVEWCAWLRSNDLPDPEDLLADPSLWKPNEREPDKVFATAWAVAECAVSEGNGKPYTKEVRIGRWHQAWRCLDKAIEIGKDLATPAAVILADPKRRPDYGKIDRDVRDVIVKLKDVIAASGLI